MPLRANAVEYIPSNPAEREILKRLAVLSAQVARLRQSGFRRDADLELGRGTPLYASEGKSLALPREVSREEMLTRPEAMLPGGLLDGGRRRTKRSKRFKNRRGTRRHRK